MAASQQQHPPLKVTGRTFNPFQSPRLIYRAAEDSPEDEDFFYAVQGDAEAQSGSQFRLLTPESKTSSQKFRKSTQEALLGAVVCLKPSSDTATTTTTTTTTDSKEGAAANAPIPIGVVVLQVHGDPAQVAHHRHSYLSIDILRAHRGRGYGGEAVAWALGYGFRMANLHRVALQAFSYNEGAVRLYRALGFVQEARLRDEVWFNGGWHDALTFGMLEDEWRAGQAVAARKWGE